MSCEGCTDAQKAAIEGCSGCASETDAESIPTSFAGNPSGEQAWQSMSASCAGLSDSLAADKIALDEVAAIAAQVAERAQMKEALCMSMSSQLIGVHEELAAARHDLAESKAMRSRETAFAQQASQSRSALEAELERHAAQVQQLQGELDVERAKRTAAEGIAAAGQAQAKQQQAVAGGVLLKIKKLESDLAAANERAATEASSAAAAAKRAESAEAAAKALQLELQRARELIEAAATNKATGDRQLVSAERAAAGLSKKHEKELSAAHQACAAASEECLRVRKRNEALERELGNLRERCGLDRKSGLADTGTVLGNLEQMEEMIAADASAVLQDAAKLNAGESQRFGHSRTRVGSTQ